MEQAEVTDGARIIYTRILELENMKESIEFSLNMAHEKTDHYQIRKFSTLKRQVNDLLLINKAIYYGTGLQQ